MEWELSKENVQPLRKGRKNVELLNQGLKAKMEAPAKCALTEQRRILLEAIDNYVGEDPLQPWLKCIEWTKEAFPSGGTQSGILPMLELCLRTFCKEAQYQSDLRYLKLWIDYANRCTEPGDIYTFLDVNDIGQSHAIFYEAYAAYMESCRNYSKANDIFQLGISRRAEPVEELKTKYKCFLERNSRSAKRKPNEEDAVDEGPIRAFGIPQPASRIGKSAARPLQTTAKQNSQPVSKFAVFVDSQFQPGSKKVPGLHSHGAASQVEPLWTTLGTQAERTKENLQQPSRWNEAKIPQRSSTKPLPTETLDVYVDEEFSRFRKESSNNVEPPQAAKRTTGASLKVRFSHIQDLKRDTEMLREAPLRNFARDLNALR